MRLIWSEDRLKPFYGRRRVRKLCDHIDLLKRMLERTAAERDTLLDQGDVVTKAQLARAVASTAQLDMLRRCHEERTALKQEIRAIREDRKRLYDALEDLYYGEPPAHPYRDELASHEQNRDKAKALLDELENLRA